MSNRDFVELAARMTMRRRRADARGDLGRDVGDDYRVAVMSSQNDRILEAMRRGESLTRASAMNGLGIGNLQAHILELKQEGYDIAGEWIEVQNRYGEACRVKSYRLATPAA